MMMMIAERLRSSEYFDEWHSMSLKIIRNDTLSRACVSPYSYSTVTMYLNRNVSETFIVKYNDVTWKSGLGSFKLGH